ncbi:agamous-like MADS-box protein AGL62 [Solanum stenotomum]|uniref:agamous-like MADS-box protein AGL62 n=1 Tax=Solanum stenotomum TaxID=172797 RepID=UPI0020D02474|nr:agamous-like MADS-box protein AGL62 [Solanum stenotomum]
MARMHNHINLQVTFSKRCDGVFKKATALFTLCGADIVVVVFSPSNKPYSCGHPSVESIMNRFLGENPPTDTNAPNPIVIAHQNANTVGLTNRKLNRLEISLEREKKYGEVLQASRKEHPIEKLSSFDLKNLFKALEAADEEIERVVRIKKERGFESPYQTIGSAFAPLRVTEHSSSDFYEAVYGSNE